MCTLQNKTLFPITTFDHFFVHVILFQQVISTIRTGECSFIVPGNLPIIIMVSFYYTKFDQKVHHFVAPVAVKARVHY